MFRLKIKESHLISSGFDDTLRFADDSTIECPLSWRRSQLRFARHPIARPAHIDLSHDSLRFADCVLSHFALQDSLWPSSRADRRRSARMAAQIHNARLRPSSIENSCDLV